MDTKIFEINEYCDSLKDLKPHLDQSFESLHLEKIILKVDHPESGSELFQKRLKKIMKYCTDLGREVEVEYV